MKKGIHPAYQKCVVTCACGNTFEVKSNKDSFFIETCSKCSPAFNENKKATHAKTGNVEKFNKKYNLN